jgi:hypothetical protein
MAAPIIKFLTFTINTLWIGCWAEQMLDPLCSPDTLTPLARKVESIIYLLNNALACDDDLVLPFLPNIFYSIGNHIRFYNLYHNMFLVKVPEVAFRL